MRTHPHRSNFLRHFVVNPQVNEFLGEDAALGQEGVVFLQDLRAGLQKNGFIVARLQRGGRPTRFVAHCWVRLKLCAVSENEAAGSFVCG